MSNILSWLPEYRQLGMASQVCTLWAKLGTAETAARKAAEAAAEAAHRRCIAAKVVGTWKKFLADRKRLEKDHA